MGMPPPPPTGGSTPPSVPPPSVPQGPPPSVPEGPPAYGSQFAGPPPPPPPGAIATAAYPPGYYAPQPVVGGERASFGIRLGAWLLDSLLYGLLSVVFIVPGVVLIASAFNDCVSVETGEDSFEILCPPGQPSGGAIAGGIALIVFGVLLTAFLYIWAMGKTGQTWGAKIVGVKVVDERTGAPLGFGRALGRSLFAYFISSAIFYLGYLWMLWDDKKQTWQDKVVNSVVVRT